MEAATLPRSQPLFPVSPESRSLTQRSLSHPGGTEVANAPSRRALEGLRSGVPGQEGNVRQAALSLAVTR